LFGAYPTAEQSPEGRHHHQPLGTRVPGKLGLGYCVTAEARSHAEAAYQRQLQLMQNQYYHPAPVPRPPRGTAPPTAAGHQDYRYSTAGSPEHVSVSGHVLRDAAADRAGLPRHSPVKTSSSAWRKPEAAHLTSSASLPALRDPSFGRVKVNPTSGWRMSEEAHLAPDGTVKLGSTSSGSPGTSTSHYPAPSPGMCDLLTQLHVPLLQPPTRPLASGPPPTWPLHDIAITNLVSHVLQYRMVGGETLYCAMVWAENGVGGRGVAKQGGVFANNSINSCY